VCAVSIISTAVTALLGAQILMLTRVFMNNADSDSDWDGDWELELELELDFLDVVM
jgi:hypothetical protein